MPNSPKKSKSGSEKLKVKNKKLLEAAATVINQTSLNDCFQKFNKKNSKSSNGRLLGYHDNSIADSNFLQNNNSYLSDDFNRM